MELLSVDRFDHILKKINSQKSILVVGDLGIDKYTYGEVSRISPEAPVPILEVTKEWPKLGLAANVTDNLNSIGVSSTLCGIIGEDINGNRFEALLEEIGQKTWGLVRSSDRMTTVKERITTSLQQICRVDYENKEDIGEAIENKLFSKIDDLKKNHGALIIQDYGKGLMTDSFCKRLIENFNHAHLPIYVDPYRTKNALIYQNATLIKPNWSEAKILAKNLGISESKPQELTIALSRKMGIPQIAITLGGEGICLYDKNSMASAQIIPTLNTEVFDVSGAGDTALSSLVSALGVGATLIEAGWIANCASGVVVAKKGTATANLSEIEDYYRRMCQAWK